jgi:hypothetical protein
MVLLSRDAPFSGTAMGKWVPGQASVYGFSFTGADPPTDLVEDERGAAPASGLAGGLVASIAKSSAGIFLVTLTSRFEFIRGHASCDKTAFWANCRTTQEAGAAGTASTVTIEVFTGAGVETDPDDVVRVVLELVKSKALSTS